MLNLIGALLSGLGGILFALTITAEVLPFAYAADPAVLPETEGRKLFDLLNAHQSLLVPAIVGTQIAIAVGVLVALIGTLLSRTMPRWLSIVGILYIIVFVGLPAEMLGRTPWLRGGSNLHRIGPTAGGGGPTVWKASKRALGRALPKMIDSEG
ncbi:hypothetical protein JOL79_29895 [Microbispora sp. RL4-1S]|uniref:Uncharacterized protein n=1 Tax=Microbispora oryzae TaxID=2806554 RepID=A0A940WV73_9ACTN|nr:hypothetical protein [Microbispora oryzae]MBP2708000.1 hypothetical protein [Microbispora oryzae]